MTAFVSTYLVIAVLLVVVDLLWLTYRGPYFRKLFASVQGGSPLEMRVFPAALVYGVIMPLLVYFGAVEPATSVTNAVWRGAVTGFLAYGLYDLTNYATLTRYTLEMTLTDMAWGTTLFAAVAGATFFLKQK
jgi:uncharacterized membrane protein